MSEETDVNVLVFAYRAEGQERSIVAQGPTRASDCLQVVWREVKAKTGLLPSDVIDVYSEWQLSDSDLEFLRSNFGAVPLSYTFERPSSEDGWPDALRAARDAMQSALQEPGVPGRPPGRFHPL